MASGESGRDKVDACAEIDKERAGYALEYAHAQRFPALAVSWSQAFPQTFWTCTFDVVPYG